jgi:hypothetical protein
MHVLIHPSYVKLLSTLVVSVTTSLASLIKGMSRKCGIGQPTSLGNWDRVDERKAIGTIDEK